ncbi:hypothetical protein TNCV_3601391 [Trichonephila clavipes]|nr:hypothetical protein TNCV_3601391 [Trichonephila clavipes]
MRQSVGTGLVISKLWKDFPEMFDSIVVVKIHNPTDISLVWVPLFAMTTSLFFKRSLMAGVGIGPLLSSSCSEGDTFRCVSWCSSFKIFLEFFYRQFIFMSRYELFYVILVHL